MSLRLLLSTDSRDLPKNQCLLLGNEIHPLTPWMWVIQLSYAYDETSVQFHRLKTHVCFKASLVSFKVNNSVFSTSKEYSCTEFTFFIMIMAL